MQIVQTTIMQTNGHQVFANRAAAEEMVVRLIECAEGETYEVRLDAKSGKALIEIFFDGKSEGFF